MATFGYQGDFGGAGNSLASMYNSQANQSINTGNAVAKLADPFMNEREGYQNQLRTLMSNPGEFSSSPFYKFAYDQGLNALQRKGNVRSGNKLAELVKYGQGMASQAYFPQANLLATLSGATTGSPAAAGLAVSGAFNRSQDQKSLGKYSELSGGQMTAGNTTPWYLQPDLYKEQDQANAALTQKLNSYGSSDYYSPSNYSYDYYSPSYGGYGYAQADGYEPTFFGDYGYEDYYGEY